MVEVLIMGMFPLFLKDGLVLPFCATICLFCLVTMTTTKGDPIDVKTGSNRRVEQVFIPKQDVIRPALQTLRNLSLAGAAALVVAMVSLKPPARLPDIFTVLIAIYSCVHFMFFLGYFYRVQLMYSSEKDDHFASTTSGRTLKIGTGRYHTSKVSGKQL